MGYLIIDKDSCRENKINHIKVFDKAWKKLSQQNKKGLLTNLAITDTGSKVTITWDPVYGKTK